MSDVFDSSLSQSDGALEAERLAQEAESGRRRSGPIARVLIPLLAAAWSIFQLAIASVVILDSVIVRAVHLSFAITLVYLSYPMLKKDKGRGFMSFLANKERLSALDLAVAALAAAVALYIFLDYAGLAARQGALITRDLAIGVLLVALVLEAARRALGPVLPIVAIGFTLYAFLGPYAPSVLAFKGVSLGRFMNQITASTEGIYGVPLDVSATIVFLFVLFGSLLDKAGAGLYFVRLAFSLLGRFKGGPAKAAVLEKNSASPNRLSISLRSVSHRRTSPWSS